MTARGTMFRVALEEGGNVSVRLFRGSVDVMVPGQNSDAGSKVSHLESGKSLRYRAVRPAGTNAVQSNIGLTAPSASLASQQEFDSVRLADLVATANRRASRQIELADPAIGELRLSGRFRIDDTQLLALRIAALFDLAIDRNSSGEITLRWK